MGDYINIGNYMGDYINIGNYYRAIKGDTRSLGYRSAYES